MSSIADFMSELSKLKDIGREGWVRYEFVEDVDSLDYCIHLIRCKDRTRMDLSEFVMTVDKKIKN